MMRLAQAGEVIGVVVAGVMIKVGYRQTRGQLESADRAALERVVLIEHAAGFCLATDDRRIDGAHSAKAPCPVLILVFTRVGM